MIVALRLTSSLDPWPKDIVDVESTCEEGLLTEDRSCRHTFQEKMNLPTGEKGLPNLIVGLFKTNTGLLPS